MGLTSRWMGCRWCDVGISISGSENSGFSHGKMVDLSNMFHSYVSLPEDNIMISIDQWDFQDPIDGGTLASTIYQAKKNCGDIPWNLGLSKKALYMESVPRINRFLKFPLIAPSDTTGAHHKELSLHFKVQGMWDASGNWPFLGLKKWRLCCWYSGCTCDANQEWCGEL